MREREREREGEREREKESTETDYCVAYSYSCRPARVLHGLCVLMFVLIVPVMLFLWEVIDAFLLVAIFLSVLIWLFCWFHFCFILLPECPGLLFKDSFVMENMVSPDIYPSVL